MKFLMKASRNTQIRSQSPIMIMGNSICQSADKPIN